MFGQIRPTTNQTLISSDKVGEVVDANDLEVVRGAWEKGAITQGAWPDLADGGMARATCIPVRFRHEVVAVVARVWSPTGGRRRGGLERAYLGIFEHLARMLVTGIYPFVAEEEIEDPPRVGDRVIVVDAAERVTFASPNAVSALHRAGVGSSYIGSTLGALGLGIDAVANAFSRRMPVVEEIERPGDATDRLPRDPAHRRRSRSSAARCSCETSPTSAAGTGSCSRRMRPSARSITG